MTSKGGESERGAAWTDPLSQFMQAACDEDSNCSIDSESELAHNSHIPEVFSKLKSMVSPSSPEKSPVGTDEGTSADDETEDDFDMLSGFEREVPASHPSHVPDRVEELTPFEVRWFYREDPSKKWRPFVGYDSCRIECRYREHVQNGSSGKCTESENDVILVCGGLFEADVVNMQCLPVYWDKNVGRTIIMRGTWFYINTGQPLTEPLARKLETEHLRYFKGVSLFPKNEGPTEKLTKKVVLTKEIEDIQVDWFSPTEVVSYETSRTNRLLHSIQARIGMTKSGKGLRRGYFVDARPDDKEADITHLVFVVHGVGQMYNKGSIIKNTSDVRELSRKMSKQYFKELAGDNKRVEFLPVEWRTSLNLDEDVVDSITPIRLRGLRSILNSVGLDILYYTSPHYRSQIVHGLQLEVNKLYQRFCERHPYFEPGQGKVSVLAHSLGSVIMHDIITGWSPSHVYDSLLIKHLEEEVGEMSGETRGMMDELKAVRERAKELEESLLKQTTKHHLLKPILQFKIENFFAIGSPLACFLALRGARPVGEGSQDDIIPRPLCRRVFNIFHPSDPIAYRMEPLVLRHYSGIKPVDIHNCDTVASQPPYAGILEQAYGVDKKAQDKNMAEATAAYGKKSRISSLVRNTAAPVAAAVQGTLSLVFSKFASSHGKEGIVSGVSEMSDRPSSRSGTLKAGEMSPVTSGSTSNLANSSNVDSVELEHRLDYQLRPGSMENQYLRVLSAHTSYWRSGDAVMFLLQHVFPQYTPSQPQPKTKKKSPAAASSDVTEDVTSSGSRSASPHVDLTV